MDVRSGQERQRPNEDAQAGEGRRVAPVPSPGSWSDLTNAASVEAFAGAWLAMQCGLIDGAERAVVVLGAPGRGPYAPIAFWPERGESSLAMSAAAEMAMHERRGAVRERSSDDGSAIAYPVIVDDLVCGVVALEIGSREASVLQAVMRQLQWGCGWLEVLMRRRLQTPRDRLVTLLELLAGILEERSYRAAATRLATELAGHFDCEWVAVGSLVNRRTVVTALSHSADFSERSNFIRAIGNAMDEAQDQGRTLLYPPGDAPQLPQIQRAHETLASEHGSGHFGTAPLFENDGCVGAVVLKRPVERPFDGQDREVLRQLGALAGPLLELKRRDERPLWTRALLAGRGGLQRLFGPGHVTLKLSTLLVTALALFLAFAEGDYRISSTATLRGSVQRVLTAPFDGYLAAEYVRAGAEVAQGDLLCQLDDRDLQLEKLHWVSQQIQHEREYRQALAAGDRAKMRIFSAQVRQAEAQLALIDEQLQRTRIVAPFSGIVVSGDLSQSLGVPVGKGDVLFEIAPLDSYRVVLEVDERDMARVAAGQEGELRLAALPHRPFPFVVEKVTPVSSARDGDNRFRVDAALGAVDTVLRPGMEGVGKIDAGREKLAWIWGHRLYYWLRLATWAWLP